MQPLKRAKTHDARPSVRYSAIISSSGFMTPFSHSDNIGDKNNNENTIESAEKTKGIFIHLSSFVSFDNF